MLVNPARERIFNVPAVVVAIVAAIGLVHAVFALLLDEEQAGTALTVLAFIPARYDLGVLGHEPWWLGWGAAIWTFVTYAFLHGSLSHLFFNLIWLLAFATPVARRFGSLRFTAFYLMAAVAGAVAHLVTHPGEVQMLVGASAAISGAMAAAIRFVFQRGGPLGALGSGDEDAYRVPAAPLSMMLRDPRALAFLAVWFGVNLLFGAGSIAIPGTEQAIAWEAHIGGFVAGMLGFSLFDPVVAAPETVEDACREPEAINENDKP